jgi:predicted N-formylglutamate amidohydrolase
MPAAMIEIRNDEIGDEAGQRNWADRLADILAAAELRLSEASHAAV